MKVKFEKVVDGINRFIDKEIYSNLNDAQEIMVRLVVGRLNSNTESIKSMLMTNGFAKTLCLVDSEGNVEIDQLLQEIRREIERKGTLEFSIPLIGRIKFTASDVDVLKDLIMR